MKTCTQCGVEKPTTEYYKHGQGLSPHCRQCNSAKCKAWRQAHPEQARTSERRRSPESVALRRAYTKAWLEENREQHLASMRAYGRTHRAEINARMRLWCKATGYTRTDEQRARRAVKRGCDASLTAKDWSEILDEYSYRCAYCLRPLAEATQDHIVPISKGGAHSRDNIVPACRSCNSAKRDLSLLVFAGRQYV